MDRSPAAIDATDVPARDRDRVTRPSRAWRDLASAPRRSGVPDFRQSPGLAHHARSLAAARLSESAGRHWLLGRSSAARLHSPSHRRGGADMKTMKAVVFKGKNQIALEKGPRPGPPAGEALIRITTTTICGTDVHIVRGEYPVRPGLILGHEPVGVIAELGAELDEYAVGERVIAGAITPCGQCFYCLNGSHSQCGGALGGWKFGNTIDGAWAEYLLVLDARANPAVIPDGLSDEAVMLCPDIFSTGLSGAESGNIRVGDAVAAFAEGPIGLCATLGAKLKGASLIIGIDRSPGRLETARRFGANVTLNIDAGDPVIEIKRLTGGRGVDVAIEALGRQDTFENALRA